MSNIMLSLDLMWKGMLAIFVVNTAIFIMANLLHRTTSETTKKQNDA